MPHEILFIFIAFFSEILGTIGGFGSSSYFVPLANIFEDFKTVLVLGAILHVFGNFSKIILFRKSIQWQIILPFGITSLLFSMIGAHYSQFLDEQISTKILGSFLILLSGFYLLIQKRKKTIHSMGLIYLLASLSGFATGLIGTGGALRGFALTLLGLPKMSFVVSSAMIDFFTDLSRTGIYLNAGYLHSDHYFYIPILLTVAWCGSWIGKKILSKISQENFEKSVLILIFLIGWITLLRS